MFYRLKCQGSGFRVQEIHKARIHNPHRLPARTDGPATVKLSIRFHLFLQNPARFKAWKPSWEVPKNTPQVYDIIRKNRNVVAVLGGHLHGFSYNTDEDGIFYCLGPGFCDRYEFLVWNVYPDRMEAQEYSVAADGNVAPVADRTTGFTFPERFRLKPDQHKAPVQIHPMEKPQESLLAEWFGPDWLYAPGYTLPPSWREDTVIMPAKEARKAVYYACEPGKTPPPDKKGKAWFDPAYEAAVIEPAAADQELEEPPQSQEKGWRECSIPASQFDNSKPKKGRAEYYFRIPFNTAADDLAKLRRCVVKRKCYAGLSLYLNGVSLPTGAGSRRYWDSYSLFAPDLLTATGDNILAASIRTSGWGRYDIDIEITGEFQQNAPSDE